MTAESLMAQTKYTIGKKAATLRLTDSSKEMCGQWPLDRRPKSHAVACEVVLRAVHGGAIECQPWEVA